MPGKEAHPFTFILSAARSILQTYGNSQGRHADGTNKDG